MKTAPLKKFAAGILAGIGSVAFSLAVAYAALTTIWPSSLPAPALSPLPALDEKLRFLRNHPEFDPRIIAVGSSITWRQIAGAEFTPLAGGPERFLNGGTVKLQIDETRALTEFYLENYSNIRTVLVMTSLPDYEDCGKRKRPLVDSQDARAYAFGGWPAPYFYLRYFSPQRYAKGVLTLAKRTKPLTGDMYIDDFGSGPVQLPESVNVGLRYSRMNYDPACAEALAKFVNGMSARGLRLVLVFAPIHPEYRRKYPDMMTQLENIAAGVRSSLPPHIQILLLHDDPAFQAKDFFDAFHLEYSAAQRLSSLIARAMQQRSVQVMTGRMIRCLDEPGECGGVHATEPPAPVTPATFWRLQR